MFDEKIIELKKQTMKYIYDENVDVYVKLQTLYEYIIKDYARVGGSKDKVVGLIEQFVSDKFEYKKEVIENVRTINRYANAGVKHFNNFRVTFDKAFVKRAVLLFNLLNNYLNKGNISRYNLDTEIFDTPKVTLYKYVEPKIENKSIKTNNDIIINSATSKTSIGFTIKNIKPGKCDYEYKSVYAVIFNLLQRSKKIEKDNIIIEYEKEKGLTVDHSIVYKYEMTILMLIKNNYIINNKLEVFSVDKYVNEMECAIDHINRLAQHIFLLMKQDKELIKISHSKSGIQIAINEDAEISIYDNLKEGIDKTIWYSPNIRYNIKPKEDIFILQNLLELLLKYKDFKPGQIEAISQILNGNESEIIIMPTGSGKSLIYYFISLLQPSPTLIVEPTEILIKDQIRNLKELHNIEDCISYLSGDNYEVNLNHKFVYLTPRVLQNKKSIVSLINANVDLKIANIILDEIHTISNWSHDFRPDYLMTSFNLKTFLDNFRYLGFTATANYRVMKDISNQLNINFDRIFTPIELNNDNIKFNFKNHKTEEGYLKYFSEIANKIVSKNEEKMIVFTKDKNTNNEILKNVEKQVKHDIDVLSDEDRNSYDAFLKGRRSILLSKTDMGIGINIPEVNKIMHYGIPISKSKYVQEIGRAGRGEKKAISYISFIEKDELSNQDLKLLDLNSSIDEILNIIRESNSDLALSFKQLLGHLDSYSNMAMRIKTIYENIKEINNYRYSHATFQLTYKNEKDKVNYETCLYFLFQMGIIYNWYISRSEKEYVAYDIEVSDQLTLENVKKKCIEYILLFGNSKETIYNIEHYNTIEEIIYELQTWYYNQFLLYHREQLVNMYEFVEICCNNYYSDDKIASILFEYFSLTSTDIEEDVDTYINRIKKNQKIVYKQINNKELDDNEVLSVDAKMTVLDEFKTDEYITVIKSVLEDPECETKYLKFEKYLESKYNVIADLYIFTYNTLKNNSPGITRLERIMKEIGKDNTFISYIAAMYKSFSNLEFKLKLVKLLAKYYIEEEFYSIIFKYNNKDLIYYNYISKIVNNRLED